MTLVHDFPLHEPIVVEVGNWKELIPHSIGYPYWWHRCHNHLEIITRNKEIVTCILFLLEKIGGVHGTQYSWPSIFDPLIVVL